MFSFVLVFVLFAVPSVYVLKLHNTNHCFKFSENMQLFELRKNFNSEVFRKIPEKLY